VLAARAGDALAQNVWDFSDSSATKSAKGASAIVVRHGVRSNESTSINANRQVMHACPCNAEHRV
jgi:hypothetical protein